MTNVAILGCGPAGLFAAHAVAQAGDTPVIFSKNRKSFMRGAQYLHQPIPGLSGVPFEIDYRLEGSVAGYRDKVYGDMSDVQVSPETMTGIAHAWDIREAYDAAWDLYRSQILDIDLSVQMADVMTKITGMYDDVISSVPAKLLCRDNLHQFRSQKVWATDYVKPLGIFEDPAVDNVVICSGHEDDWWYRASRIQRFENTEYDYEHKPLGRAWEVEKPIDNDCDCWQGIQRVGRYGRWTKGVLSHSAFYDIDASYV